VCPPSIKMAVAPLAELAILTGPLTESVLSESTVIAVPLLNVIEPSDDIMILSGVDVLVAVDVFIGVVLAVLTVVSAMAIELLKAVNAAMIGTIDVADNNVVLRILWSFRVLRFESNW